MTNGTRLRLDLQKLVVVLVVSSLAEHNKEERKRVTFDLKCVVLHVLVRFGSFVVYIQVVLEICCAKCCDILTKTGHLLSVVGFV